MALRARKVSGAFEKRAPDFNACYWDPKFFGFRAKKNGFCYLSWLAEFFFLAFGFRFSYLGSSFSSISAPPLTSNSRQTQIAKVVPVSLQVEVLNWDFRLKFPKLLLHTIAKVQLFRGLLCEFSLTRLQCRPLFPRKDRDRNEACCNFNQQM